MITESQLEGFRSISWLEVKDGQEVFLRGTHLGIERPYGPHIVENQNRRTLKNKKKRTFMHYPEDLLIKVNK